MEPPDFLKKIVDFTRLMEGENRDNYDADDITHWRAVYADLIQFKEQLLGQMLKALTLPPPQRGGGKIEV
jgi:hypothetical protein